MRTTIMFPGREYWKSPVFWHDAKCSHCREPFVIGGDYWQTKVQNPNHVVSVPPCAYHDHCMVDHLLRECHFYKGCYGDMLSEMIRAQYEADKWKGNHDNVVRLNRELQGKPPRAEVKHDLQTQAKRIYELECELAALVQPITGLVDTAAGSSRPPRDLVLARFSDRARTLFKHSPLALTGCPGHRWAVTVACDNTPIADSR